MKTLQFIRPATLLLCLALLWGCGEGRGTGFDVYRPADGDRPTIKLMFIGQITDTANATPLPEAPAAILASAKRINAAGGVNGRLLEVHFCDDKADPNEAAKCAREAVASDVVATVGNTSNFGEFIFPILEQGNIASIGHNPISRADFSSPVAFPLQTGSPGMVASTAALLAKQGFERIHVATVDSPAGGLAGEFARMGLTGTAATMTGLSLVPIGAPDYATYAHSAIQDSDAVMVSMNADQAARFIVALHQADPGTVIGVPIIATPPTTLGQIGAPSEGIWVSANYRPINADSPANRQFRADMAKYAPDFRINGFSQQAWLAVETFARAMRDQRVTEFAPAAVLEAMNSLENLETGSMIPPLTTTVENEPPFNRLFIDQVLFGRVRDGKVVLISDKWHDAL